MPVTYEVHQDIPLTNLLVAYIQRADWFVADRAFPILEVSDKAGKYATYGQGDYLRDEMEERAPGADFAEADYHVSWSTYETKQWALAQRLADEVVAAATNPVAPERDAVAFLTQKMLIRRERDFASSFMTTSVWGTDGSVTAKFSTVATSDPVGDVRTAKRTIEQAGVTEPPDTIVMGLIVEDRLIVHPDILDRIKYVENASGDAAVRQAMAAVFGVRQILVSRGVYDSADEGQTASISPIIDDDMLIMSAPPGPGMLTAIAGKTLVWSPGGGRGVISRVRLEAVNADLIRIQCQYQQKQVVANAGYFYADCTD